MFLQVGCHASLALPMSMERVEEKLAELERFSGLEPDLLELHSQIRSEFSGWRQEIDNLTDANQKKERERDYEA